MLNRTKSFTKRSRGHSGKVILTKGLLTELPLVKVSILGTVSHSQSVHCLTKSRSLRLSKSKLMATLTRGIKLRRKPMTHRSKADYLYFVTHQMQRWIVWGQIAYRLHSSSLPLRFGNVRRAKRLRLERLWTLVAASGSSPERNWGKPMTNHRQPFMFLLWWRINGAVTGLSPDEIERLENRRD